MSNETRQPSGTPTGGQFASTGHTETGTTLDAAPAYGTLPEIIEARDALADALNVPAEQVTIEVDDAHMCGQEPGTVHVRLSADVPDDVLNQEVSIGFYREPSGRTAQMACTVEWDREPLPGLDYTRDSTSTAYDYSRGADTDTVRETVTHMTRQAALQRALNTQLNDPQSAAKLASTTRGRDAWYDILRADAQVTAAGTSFVFTDRRGGRESSKLGLDVDGTGQIAHGWIDTDYGTVRLAGTTNLHRVCGRLEQELRWATDNRSDAEPTKDHIQARLLAALTDAR